MINWMKYRPLYFAISGIVIALGVFSMLKWGFKAGIDFTGGSVLEYKLPDGGSRIVKSTAFDQAKRDEIKNHPPIASRGPCQGVGRWGFCDFV